MPNKLDFDYIELVKDILRNGNDKGDRTGTGTRSVFGRVIRHNMVDGFPLLTTKKMSLKNIKAELYWFLQGDTNIRFLVERGCNIWNGDAYKNYVTNVKEYTFDVASEMGWCNGNYQDFVVIPFTMKEFLDKIKSDDAFTKRWGELGPIYGKQWRNWDGIDQVQELIDTLINNPDSRRMMVNAWNVPQIKKAVLPPCHYGFQCYTEELTYEERYDVWFKNNYETGMEYYPGNKVNFDNPYYSETPTRRLSLSWNQRSVDTGLGLPYNIASYGLLLLMLADEVNMVPGELIGFLGDTHIYNNQIEPIQEQLHRKGLPLPTVIVQRGINSHCDGDDIKLFSYQSHPAITLPLSN